MTPAEDEILKDFLEQTKEDLESLDSDLVALEKDPTSSELLARIFRVVHNLKGGSGYLEFANMEHLAHEAESLLDLLRNQKMSADQHVISVLLNTADAIRELLGRINENGNDAGDDFSSLIHEISLLHSGKPAWTNQAVSAVASAQLETESAPSASEFSDGPVESHAGPSNSSIRVDVEVLDDLMNLVGELVLVRNQILQLSTQADDTAGKATSQRLNLVTAELQERVMQTRMRPIRSVFSRLPRVVRDAAVSCDREIDLQMAGHDTELDKSVVEAVHDPLVHIVRNAVAHAIEPADERQKLGKPAKGKISLRAYHEGGDVYIEITDDGGGIDAHHVREKAVSEGMIDANLAHSMNERECLQLICLPGFSTSAEVTNVSGRGVGMDVVRANIETIGGTLDISSKRGVGTTFKIKIPLTLAIIPGLIVYSGDARYVFPQVHLVELLRLEGVEGHKRIQWIKDSPILRLRGSLLPITYLRNVFELPQADAQVGEEQITNIVVLEVDGRTFGVVVDSIIDTEEIVVKPLGEELRRIPVFAGATIMGDGQVALIIDVLGLARCSNLMRENDDRLKRLADQQTEQSTKGRLEQMLTVMLDRQHRVAIPLDHIARLEKLSASQVEWAGDRPVMQYREGLLPLVDLRLLLSSSRRPQEWKPGQDELWQVVVCKDEGGHVGIIVSEILDICSEHIEIQMDDFAEFVQGTAVIQNRVTQMIDISSVLKAARRDPRATVLVEA